MIYELKCTLIIKETNSALEITASTPWTYHKNKLLFNFSHIFSTLQKYVCSHVQSFKLNIRSQRKMSEEVCDGCIQCILYNNPNDFEEMWNKTVCWNFIFWKYG